MHDAVLTSTHNLCFEQKLENFHKFLPENCHFYCNKKAVYCIKVNITVMTQSFGTGRSGQTVQTQIGMLLEEQSLFAIPFELF